jgi:glycosyltransferase involved in cell wall biosynthesis
MTASQPVSSPLVSIIVPARNEEVSLSACLASLVAQTGVSFEIIVVNDHSTDRTAEIAHSFSDKTNNVRVIDAPELPAGWTGKNNAVMAGAKQASGSWFLFTDADTVHLPGSLAKALDEAEQHGAALLSYSPQQVMGTFWEKALMPVIFAELALTFRPKQISDPSSPAAAANGQYLLISLEAYRAVGGHAAVAGNILEDVAFARVVKSSGRKIFFRVAGDAVQTRMYRNFQQLREGWTKNLALLFPHPVRLALLRFMQLALATAGIVLAAVFAVHGKMGAAAGCFGLSVVMGAIFGFRITKVLLDWNALTRHGQWFTFIGLPVFSYLLLRSALLHNRGNVEWKGRTYPAERIDSQPAPQSGHTALGSQWAKHKSNL